MTDKPEDETLMCVISPPESDADAMLITIGVPAAAWEQMRAGHAHALDLTSAGLPIKLVVYGGADMDEVRKVLEDDG